MFPEEYNKIQKEIIELEKEKETLKDKILELKMSKKYIINAEKEKYYSNLRNNADYSLMSECNITKEEALELTKVMFALQANNKADWLNDEDFWTDSNSIKRKFEENNLDSEGKINWKIVEEACEKGFSFFEIALQNEQEQNRTANVPVGYIIL